MLRAWAVAEDMLDGAIYQDMGINGMDFYVIAMRNCMTELLRLPEFDWSEFADH